MSDYDRPSHTYVECCDRVPLLENTARWLDSGVWVRVCREGYGCTTDTLTANR